MLLKLILVLVLIAVGVYVATKYFKKFKDEDNDGIPDVIEDKFADIKEDVEGVIEDVKDKVEDIKEDVKDFVEEVKDVPAKLSRRKPGPKRTPRKSSPAPRDAKSGGGVNAPETGSRAQGGKDKK